MPAPRLRTFHLTIGSFGQSLITGLLVGFLALAESSVSIVGTVIAEPLPPRRELSVAVKFYPLFLPMGSTPHPSRSATPPNKGELSCR